MFGQHVASRNRTPIAVAALVGAAVVLTLGGVAPAAVITVTGDTADRGVNRLNNDTPTLSGTTATEVRVGRGSNGGLTLVVPFQLPALPAGETIQSADFGAFFLGELNNNAAQPGYNTDLFALAPRASSTVITGDYGGGTLIGDNFVGSGVDSTNDNSNDVNARISTGDAADASLAAYLNSVYLSDPAAAGKFVFFRLAPDAATPIGGTSFDGFIFGTSDNTDEARRPVLTLTTVPEPTGLGALAAAAGGLAVRRRGR